jgi:hypothetical protein
MRNYLFVLFILFCFISKAERDSTNIAKNSISLDILGIGGYGSINYERMIYNFDNNLKIISRIGLTSYNLTDFTTKFNPDIIIPISISVVYGKKHNLEVGVGQVISNVVKVSQESYEPIRETNFHANFTLGYRYQKSKGGFIYKIHYTPLIEFYDDFKHWGGISIGYAF